MNLVSVITPTIPSRAKFLRECELSVAAQTWPDVEHVSVCDTDGRGNSYTTNRCAEAAEGEWLVPLADDDLLLPGGIEALMAERENADIVYAPPLVTGNEDRWWFFQSPPVIPSFALIKKGLWQTIGGYDEGVDYEEDRGFWTKALELEATFVRVDYPCWVYRQHDSNKSFNKENGT